MSAQMQKVRVMRAAGLMMLVNLVSLLLGYVRDIVMSHHFGQDLITDAFNSAFTIPDTVYRILVGGALASAFIPVFSSYIVKDDHDNAWQVSSILINWVTLIMLAVIGFCMIFTPQLMRLLVTGFDEETMRLAVTLTRIMLIQPLFMGLAGISMGILHSYQNFTTPALGMLLYNAMVVLMGALLVAPVERLYPGYGVAAFSIGVVLGSMLYFLIQVPALHKIDFRYERNFNLRHPGFIRLIHLMIPLLISLSAQSINQIVNQNLASYLEGGAITALRYANKFMNVPVTIFAVNIAIATFPTLTRQAAEGDIPEFKKSLSLAIRTITFICLPSAIGLAVLREPIIRVMFETGGEFTAADTVFAGQALFYYCIGLVFAGLVNVLLRAFYALQNTKIPVAVSVVCVASNLLFSVLLVGPMGHRGLALAFSLAEIIRCLALFLLLRLRLRQMDMRNMAVSLLKIGAVCVGMGLVCWGVMHGLEGLLDMTRKTYQAIALAASMGVAILIYFGATYALKMEEAKLVVDMFKRKLGRKKPAATVSGGE